jgi:hypothetical protein
MQRLERPPNGDAWRDRARCNRARRTHDPAYDGVFFTCVRTTRIYCRSICPSAHARARNVFFVPSAAAAERLGFRPCLRCRPEAAQGSPAWHGDDRHTGPAHDRRWLPRRAHGGRARQPTRGRAAPPVTSVHESCRSEPGRRGRHTPGAGREATDQRYGPAARRHRLRSRLQERPAVQRRIPKNLSASALELPARPRRKTPLQAPEIGTVSDP